MFALAGKPLFNAYATDDNIVHLCRTLTVEEVGAQHERKLYQCGLNSQLLLVHMRYYLIVHKIPSFSLRHYCLFPQSQ